MNIHEYQARELFERYGIPVGRGAAAMSAKEAVKAAEGLKAPYIIKAQIHSGGRGKAGGVKLASSIREVEEVASRMLGMTLVTRQTGPAGKKVSKILVAEAAAIREEYYFAVSVDRAAGQLVLIGSREGGVEIEEVSRTNPEKIVKVAFSLQEGLKDYHIRYALDSLGLEYSKALADILAAMVQLFIEKDCSLVEINPLALLEDGSYLAADAKINFDDNALYRHPDIEEMRDPAEENEFEMKAKQNGLSYVSIGGDIGCMVNGAGLAMATMDMIHYLGARPANFLDVGGTATAERVARAFEIILSDPQVRIIMVNIFGGIVRCDAIAQGIVEAVKTIELRTPVVVRFEGTNMDAAREIIAGSGLQIVSVNSLYEAAKYCVDYVRGGVSA
ncbi:MAG: ADP-forming succinate--CoA ligase subunit beta [Erysipelotrichaceae bacterium]|nr:ADP-forming succinate--CoA ligase subunit beta [Erysipelotrichaceae bacterium]